MADQYGQFLVTTSRHVNAINKLADFWSMKSFFMRMKTELGYDPAREEAVMNYFLKYSDLGKCHFWQCLTSEEKVKCLRHFRLQEMKDKAVRIMPDTSKAEVYLVLQGTATVLTGSYSEETVEEGTVFGSVGLFDQVTELHRWRIKRDPEPTFDSLPPLKELDDVIIGKMVKGCLLRLKLEDFYMHVIRETPRDDSVLEEQQQRDEDERISGLAWEDMTEDDHFYVRVYHKAKKVLSPTILGTLDNCKLIPRNARTTAYKYYHTGNPGKELVIRKHDQPNLYVFINGGVRLEVGVPRRNCISSDNGGVMHTLSFKQKGQKALVVKKNTMPLTSLRGGAVMMLTADCFTVTDPVEEEDDETLYSAKPHSNTLALTMNASAKLKILSSSGSLTSSPVPSVAGRSSSASETLGRSGLPEMGTFSPSRPTTKEAVRFVGGKRGTFPRDYDDGGPSEENEGLYDLRVVFDRPTDYLQIPISLIDSLLASVGERDRVTMAHYVKGFRREVSGVRNGIVDRINGVRSWIEGNSDFFPVERVLGSIGPTTVSPASPVPGKGRKNSNNGGKAALLRHTRGSFTQAPSSSSKGIGSLDSLSEGSRESKRETASFYTLRMMAFEEIERKLDASPLDSLDIESLNSDISEVMQRSPAASTKDSEPSHSTASLTNPGRKSNLKVKLPNAAEKSASARRRDKEKNAGSIRFSMDEASDHSVSNQSASNHSVSIRSLDS